MDSIHVTQAQQSSIDAYAVYVMNGGEQRFGPFNEKNHKLFLQDQKTNFKQRPYTFWRNSAGKDCKAVGPATKCFCDHRYKEHDFVNPKNKMIKCLAKGCNCKCYLYVPVHGSYDFKCLCKHSYKVHDPSSTKCTKCPCLKISSAFSCSCGEQFGTHRTVVETREERLQQGRSVSEAEGIMMEAMGIGGGLEDFSGLVGYGESFGRKVDDFNDHKALGMGPQDRKALFAGDKLKSIESNARNTQGKINQLEPTNHSLYQLLHTPHRFTNT